jgi:two-component system phosphate regulon sensor histidine kinase PhoR
MPRVSMFWQVFLAFGSLIVLTLGVLGGVVGAWVEQQALSQIEERLKSKAILIQEVVRDRKVDDLRQRVEALREKTEARITLIAKNGKVLIESDRDPEDLDDHGNRPEVEAARTAPFGVATRYSATLKMNMMYVAARVPDSAEIAFVRIALPVTEVQAQAARLRNLVWGSAGAMALLALLLA